MREPISNTHSLHLTVNLDPILGAALTLASGPCRDDPRSVAVPGEGEVKWQWKKNNYRNAFHQVNIFLWPSRVRGDGGDGGSNPCQLLFILVVQFVAAAARRFSARNQAQALIDLPPWLHGLRSQLPQSSCSRSRYLDRFAERVARGVHSHLPSIQVPRRVAHRR